MSEACLRQLDAQYMRSDTFYTKRGRQYVESPGKVGLRGRFLTVVMVKFAKQVFLCAKGIMRICGWSKELAFALFAPGHCGNRARISQDDEIALCHGADSLSQSQGLYHYKELRPEMMQPLRAGQRVELRAIGRLRFARGTPETGHGVQ